MEQVLDGPVEIGCVDEASGGGALVEVLAEEWDEALEWVSDVEDTQCNKVRISSIINNIHLMHLQLLRKRKKKLKSRNT